VASSQLTGVGVGSPGLVDEQTGAVTSARNLPGWDGRFELGSALSSGLGTKVFVGNDVQVATEAEFRLGAGKPYRSLLGVFWGTGVGGGVILNGKPWLGRGGAGEIGHMVVEMNGARCTCGRRGCMEAYAGRAAMEARARKRVEKGKRTDLFHLMEERGRTRLTSSIWAHALERGDKLASQIIDEAIEALGNGIASAVNLLDVEAVIIGGGLGVRFGEPYVERIAKAMQPHLFHDENPPDVKVASLGDLGGAIGAALLARNAR
jgi:glucokinase